MNLIALVILIVVCMALLVWAVDQVPQLAPMHGLLKALIIVLGVLVIAQRSGLF